MHMEGVLPLSLADLWRLFALHMDEDTIRGIHPWMVSGRVVASEGAATYEGLTFPTKHVVEREIRIARRTLRNTWTYRVEPPRVFSYQVRGVQGFVSTFDNTYRGEGAGTRVVTDAQVNIGRVPRFLQRRIAGRLLERADAEDLAYVRKYGLQRPAEVSRPKGT